MRIARVLHASSATPLVALERDGALYDVAELDRIFDTPFAPDRFARAGDFQARVIALGGAGLAELDARLRAGERPTEARLLPEDSLWLPPCDTERALLLHGLRAAADDALRGDVRCRVGVARALLGHGAAIPFPAGETRPEPEPELAVILGEDLAFASSEDAGRAILGYTILNAWRAGDDEERAPAHARRVPAQLGPVLVTAEEVGAVATLRAQVRADGRPAETTGGAIGAAPETLAALSRWVPLRAGDVIGVAPISRGQGEPGTAWGDSVEIVVERLGKLAGRAIRVT